MQVPADRLLVKVWHLYSRVTSEPAGEDVTLWFRTVPTSCLPTLDGVDDTVPFDDATAERSESVANFMVR